MTTQIADTYENRVRFSRDPAEAIAIMQKQAAEIERLNKGWGRANLFVSKQSQEIEWWEKNFEEACHNIKIDCAKLAEQYFNSAGLQNKYTISEFILDKNREV